MSDQVEMRYLWLAGARRRLVRRMSWWPSSWCLRPTPSPWTTRRGAPWLSWSMTHRASSFRYNLTSTRC